MSSQAASGGVTNRWLIASAGVVMQVALGAVYAWSVFRKTLVEEYSSSVTAVNATFSITIFTLGVAAFFGGLWMARVGPRIVAITAGVLYGAGVFLASFSAGSLPLLYITYGVISGIGIGLGYIVPVATLIKWFPDKRGFITGVAVAGFGGGAAVTAIIARSLVEYISVFQTFAILGIVYLIAVVGAGFFMKNPPEGWTPEGYEPTSDEGGGGTRRDYDLGGALKTWQWFALWAILFLNVSAGIAIISDASGMAQELSAVDAALGTTLVTLISFGNAAGRFLWAWLSDAIGRANVFLVMFLLQAALFFLMPLVSASFVLLAILSIIIVSCYGGGFGTMPAFSADYFGSANVGKIYGLMLTAWSVGGAAGPLLLSSILDATGGYANTFYILAGVMLLSAVVPLIVRPPKSPERRLQEVGTGAEARA